MSHKTIAQTFLQMIINGEITEAFDKHVAVDGFTHHNHYTPAGREELIRGMQGNHDNFPDKIFNIEMTIEEDDKVMIYSTMKFTPEHAGLRIVHIFRFVDDQIVEMRDVAMQLE